MASEQPNNKKEYIRIPKDDHRSIADREYEHQIAWWMKQEAKQPLPDEWATLMDEDEEAFIKQVMEKAFWSLIMSYYDQEERRHIDVMNHSEQRRVDGSWIWTLYLTPHPVAKKAFLAIMQYYSGQQIRNLEKSRWYVSKYHLHTYTGEYCLIPAHPAFFRYMKAVYKLSELKRDTHTWGVLAARFDYDGSSFGMSDPHSSKWTRVYDKGTRNYLRRRSWRTLRSLGEQGSSDYVKLATELLLSYKDTMGRYSRVYDIDNKEYTYSYQKNTLHLWLMNHVLYSNSKRFALRKGRTWKPVTIADLAKSAPFEREEAFPELWDQAPDQVLRLFLESHCTPVIQFAGRALLLAHPNMVETIQDKDLQQMIKGYSSAHREFATRLWLQRITNQSNWFPAWLEFVQGQTGEVVSIAKEFLVHKLENLSVLEKKDVVMSILKRIPHPEASTTEIYTYQELLQGSLSSVMVTLTLDQQKAIVQELLQGLEHSGLYTIQIELIEQLLRNQFQSTLQHFSSLEVITSFAKAQMVSLQRLAGEMLLAIPTEQITFTAHEILPLFEKPEHSVYAEELPNMVREFIQRNYAYLQIDVSWIVEFVSISGEEHRVFVTQFLTDHFLEMLPSLKQLVTTLWERMMDENQPQDVRDYIRDHLLGSLYFSELLDTPLEQMLLLINHTDSHYQQLGTRIYLASHQSVDSLSFLELKELAHCKIASVRGSARELMDSDSDSAHMSTDWLVNLVETDWVDTREWIFHKLQSYSSEQITPDLIYGLLDTARKDIQQFAMDLVEKHRARLDQRELLLRASESTDLVVHEFALELADQVSWDVEMVEKLDVFFRTILFRVNSGRNAKRKALDLLLHLSQETEELALQIAPLLADVASNGTKVDFEKILFALAKIQVRFPAVSSPLQLV
ncbi:hypothetical protein [Baia soyae]|uniref:Uncharacterized protein n=1 Tax=Baia soyae TaxID=1544746 RepID=A0A4V2SX90_9BACL|nr:hypothetical protein [Baia soyae]TCP65316.1 hypothetical protein EDD57_1342 [Baia soyae]